jgi:hypothetical protein
MNALFQKISFASLLFLMAVSFNLTAQAPQRFSYQAVVRDAAGNLVVNRPVGIRFTILRGTATGIAVFAETHRPTTNNDGLASVEIGGGSALFNAMGNIDWSLGPYFLKTEIDPNGATAYSIVGTNQLLSVPYALYAERSANPGNPGLSTLVRTEGTLRGQGGCRFGGTKVMFGLDSNRNNILDANEVDNRLTTFVCNGKDGKGISSTVDNGNGTFTFNYTDGSSFTTGNLTGPQGPTGAIGPQGLAGANGQNGVSITNSYILGDSLYVQLSNGQNLNTGYIRGSAGPIGPQGIQGNIGANGAEGLSTVVKTTIEPAGPNCGTGGVKLEFGLDNNRNRVLDSLEMSPGSTRYVCNGEVGPTGIQGPTGNVGPQGLQGPVGPAGPQGNQGLSAYQIWLSLGNVGSEQDFLNSLVGPLGPQGNSSGGGPTFINPINLYNVASVNTYTANTVTSNIFTTLGTQVNSVVLYYEYNNPWYSSQYDVPVICKIDALTNGITYEVCEHYDDLSGNNNYAISWKSGQIILPVGQNGTIQFTNTIYMVNLRVMIVGYFQ